jgi:hypothetical protein
VYRKRASGVSFTDRVNKTTIFVTSSDCLGSGNVPLRLSEGVTRSTLASPDWGAYQDTVSTDEGFYFRVTDVLIVSLEIRFDIYMYAIVRWRKKIKNK